MIEGHFEKYSMTFTGLVMGNVFSNSMTRMNSRLVLFFATYVVSFERRRSNDIH